MRDRKPMRDGQDAGLARKLRRKANAPETAAWSALRTLRARGIAVRRQHPVGRHIVDFAIVRRRIVIEIDGGVHRLPEVALRDQQRQAAIESLGWRVIRIDAASAMNSGWLVAFLEKELGL
ncbi:MAG TPA: endonuclease domain-containing protein [Parvularcula sp.]|nr:endonuclease domain-containing protein [Parvularcula sp.]